VITKSHFNNLLHQFMNYILFDGPARNALLPFTFTRPVADILIGIMTIRQKWELRLGSTTTTLTEEYLSSNGRVGRECYD
jgi:Sugar nucleotidyl transferase